MLATFPGKLDQLVFDPGSKGKSVGNALSAEAQRLMPAGFTLWANIANERACAFYERQGMTLQSIGLPPESSSRSSRIVAGRPGDGCGGASVDIRSAKGASVMRLMTLMAMVIGIVAPMSASGQRALDPATVIVPDVSLPKDKAAAQALIDNGWKYFFFHKAGVSFDAALMDVAFCYRYLPAVAVMQLPAYSAWGSGAPAPKTDYYRVFENYGLVGVGIGALVEGPLLRRNRQSRMRRCMETRGYKRYAMAEATWEALSKGDAKITIPIFAKRASGPKPDLPEPQK
jgi:hypothetical protein